MYEHSLLLSAILAHLFLLFPLPSILSRVPPTASDFNHSLKATSNRISFTNTPELNHTQAPMQEPEVTTHVVTDTFIKMTVIYIRR